MSIERLKYTYKNNIKFARIFEFHLVQFPRIGLIHLSDAWLRAGILSEEGGTFLGGSVIQPITVSLNINVMTIAGSVRYWMVNDLEGLPLSMIKLELYIHLYDYFPDREV